MSGKEKGTYVLRSDDFKGYIEDFNSNDEEKKVNYIDNKGAWEWLKKNIPFFEASDKGLEEIYYFRWWTFRKHIKETPDGFVITEFLPDVTWSGQWNTISCAASHHFYEGRWLRNRKYLKDYANFWFSKNGEPRRYSFGAADAIREWALVTQDQQLAIDLYPYLAANYQEWEKSHQDANGLFWQIDDRDGMEKSIGGSGYRPSINSYMYGEAVALGEIAKWAANSSLSVTTTAMAGTDMESDLGWKPEHSMEFRMKAAKLKELINDRIWDEKAAFFKTLPQGNADDKHADVKELVGYIPWCFNIPIQGREEAWRQVKDPDGFYAPYGPTTAERRHPQFRFEDTHECLWNGPSWPYATSQTLKAMANLLNNYKQNYISKEDYLELLRIYARSQHLKLPDGRTIPFIDENLDPDTGEWIARSILHSFTPEQIQGKGDRDRGRDYNHSSFNDLVITGLVGLRPRTDHAVEINPLVPEDSMDYFCLDGVRYHDCDLTILWDRTGERYNKGRGLHVFADGTEIGSAPSLQWILAELPQTGGGWQKYDKNPLLGGGELGGMMDVTLLKEDGKYRMWGTLWHKQRIVEFESADGIHWSDYKTVFGPNPDSGWEDSVNRQMVLKKDGLYHIWYMGGANGKAYIGYATSKDGSDWKRMGDKPVLSPELPWEKVAVMNPHVIWDEDMNLFRMWYAAGGLWEPDAIGYATSLDGINWTKYAGNPVIHANPDNLWEQERIGAAQVICHGGWHYALYIGYRDIDHAQIGMARSRDGITNWERHPGNPIVRPGQDSFDKQGCYKPFALYDGKQWMLWYNGGRGALEKIALVLHEGEDFGF